MSESIGNDIGLIDTGDFELRADHVGEDVLRTGTVIGDWFDDIHKTLLERSLALLVGPRGCGKTHMMRFTWLQCTEDPKQPLALYASFNRYLRLEPLLKARSDAGSLFHTWILSRVVLALDEAVRRTGARDASAVGTFLGLEISRFEMLANRLERGFDLSVEEEADAQRLSVESVVRAIQAACVQAGRKRTILLFDDAALTLTPDFLAEFFDVVRAIKRTDIAPKCSVYPGSTEYGPRFHAVHEGKVVPVWLSIEHPNYCEIMAEIGERRFPEGVRALGKDTNEVLMYTAFGVPRAYLSLLREMYAAVNEQGQRALNRVVQEHRDGKVSEYRSLEKKMPRFGTVVRTGADFFFNAVEAMRQANDEVAGRRDEKQLLLGIEASDFTSLTTRMIQFLIEAGLLYEHPEVSHGPERRYRRFTPHLAALIAARAFAGRTRGGSPSTILEFLRRRATKHPVRRKLATLLSSEALSSMKLDLPPCQNCQTARLTEGQKFCMHCGTRLADPSTFTLLMNLPVFEVPNLTSWQREKIKEHGIHTIRDLLAFQDPGTELRKIHRVGVRRAERIISSVEAYVDEFLS